MCKTSFTAAEAQNGVDVIITWSPVAGGQTNATLTLSSAGVDNVVVSIQGTAEVAIPTITANVSELTFSGKIDQASTKTFNVTGQFINQDVTVTLNNPSNVFTVSTNTIVASALQQGVNVTVTFNSDSEGTFTGTITLASQGAESVTINLSGTTTAGGTADDVYLNIANYQSIDAAGWRKALVDTLYKYTEYKDNKVAWLTLPVYGAVVGAKYSTISSNFGSGHPQKRMDTNISDLDSNPYTGGIEWTNTPTYENPYCGNGTYFSTATSRVLSNFSSKGTTLRSVSFYVTNTTAVKLLGKHAKSNNSNYPTYLNIYECTITDDGNLSVAPKTTHNINYYTSNSTADLTLDGLDASKIYKVEAGVYRGYLYEIAFQTPLAVTIIGDVNRDGIVNVTDVVAIVDIILEDDFTPPYIWPSYDHEAADINGDGIINVTDAVSLVDIILEE